MSRDKHTTAAFERVFKGELNRAVQFQLEGGPIIDRYFEYNVGYVIDHGWLLRWLEEALGGPVAFWGLPTPIRH